MQLLLICTSIIFSCLSTAIMLYVSMATPIGPWIAPTLALCAMILLRVFAHKNCDRSIGYIVASSSIGGILATAIGFSYPTIYFLNPEKFDTWMQNPWSFVLSLILLAAAAGWFGMWIANVCEESLIVEKKLSFPIGQLVAKMITAGDQIKRAYYLLIGFASSMFFSVLQDGLFAIKSVLPRTVVLLQACSVSVFRIPIIPFEIWPMLWAIGFVTGHVIAIPLVVGAFARFGVAEPLQYIFFKSIDMQSFMLAFGSGLAVSGFLMSVLKVPKSIKKLLNIKGMQANNTFKNFSGYLLQHKEFLVEALFMLTFVQIVLWYLGFQFFAQWYLLIATLICTYQIVVIAGKIGLAQLGRFATFVMVPSLFLFSLDINHVVYIATFVEIAGGVATDILFGRMMGRMVRADHATLKSYQYLGLIVSCIASGIFFYVLARHFQIGSTLLYAQRAQARQLLLQAREFNGYVLCLGALFGILLKKIKLNPMLVLGGLLMPINVSIGLIFGGALTLLVKDKEQYYPFWSGVFAAQSLWMLIRVLFT